MNCIKKHIKGSIYFVVFIIKACYSKSFINNIEKNKSGTVAVLANGPSLKEVLPELVASHKTNKIDFIVLNFFAFDPAFNKIKPQHYCLADPMFLREDHRIDDVRKLFTILEKIDWLMHLYIPKKWGKDFLTFSKLKNKNIIITKINDVEYRGEGKIKNLLYKRNLAIPRFQTVANMAIYVALLRGYTQINLYGVEHTFFDSLAVNDKNQLCRIDSHFYDQKEPQLHPIIKGDTLEVIKISEYIKEISRMFKSHDELFDLSQYLNVKIVNKTKKSLIDSYERG